MISFSAVKLQRVILENTEIQDQDFDTQIRDTFLDVSTIRDAIYPHLMHIQYLHRILESQPDLKYIRDRMKRGKYANKNQAITINTQTREILHQFGPRSIPYASQESSCAFKDIYHDMLKFCKIDMNQFVKLLLVPIGLMIQMCWYVDRWIIASRSFININSICINTDITVEQMIQEHLHTHKLSISDLDPNRLYTFIIQDSRYQTHQSEGIPQRTMYPDNMEKSLFLVSIFDRQAKTAVQQDVLKTSNIPRLYSKRVSTKLAFEQNQLPTIATKMYNQPAQYSIYSLIIIAPDGTYYEVLK